MKRLRMNNSARRQKLTEKKSGANWLRRCVLRLLCFSLLLSASGCARRDRPLKMAVSADPAEQIIGWMVAEMAKDQNIPMRVIEIEGGTTSIQPALANGMLDATVEFSQDAWNNVLKKRGMYTGDKLGALQENYASQSLDWIPLSHVIDHYTLAVRFDVVRKNGLETFSDLSKVSGSLVFGADKMYFEREDGYPRLQNTYNFGFATTKNLPTGQMYEYLDDDLVQVIPVHSLDGHLNEEMMIILEDDLHAYPDSTAGIVLSQKGVRRYPELLSIAWQIADGLNSVQMRQLCRYVEQGYMDARQTAVYFCKSQGWIIEDTSNIYHRTETH